MAKRCSHKACAQCICQPSPLHLQGTRGQEAVTWPQAPCSCNRVCPAPGLCRCSLATTSTHKQRRTLQALWGLLLSLQQDTCSIFLWGSPRTNPLKSGESLQCLKSMPNLAGPEKHPQDPFLLDVDSRGQSR